MKQYGSFHVNSTQKKLTQSNFHGSWVIDVESIEILIHTKF